jgi:molecular chaperone GrpE
VERRRFANLPVLIDYVKRQLSRMKKTDTSESAPVTPEAETEAAAAPVPAPESAPESPALTPEQLAELQARAAKADENWERLVRTSADFDNFKKRAAREKQDAIKYATESLLQKILPVLDNFEAALAAAQNSSADSLKSLQDGVAMIHSQLKNTLTEAGLEEVDATGKPFDPNIHEAVSQQESAEVAEGIVLQQLRKGYKLRDRLLRPATVVVAKAPAAEPQ